VASAAIPTPDGPIDAYAHPTLEDILDLEQVEEDIFRGRSPHRERVRVFGGQVAAQSIRAAQATVPGDEHHLHSMHAYFLRGGDWRHPILYRVDKIRDGRSFTTRRVVAIQYGEAIFNLEASFQKDEVGLDFATPMYDVDMSPDDVDQDGFAGLIDSREVPPEWIPADVGPARWIWFRAAETIPTDRDFQVAALIYASDHGPMGAMRNAHIGDDRLHRMMGASLDHLVWLHRDVDMSQWHFYDLRASSNFGARGFANGMIHRADGTLVATTTQEGLIRPWRERSRR
jgi:acyl-CoA thioesterase-2